MSVDVEEDKEKLGVMNLNTQLMMSSFMVNTYLERLKKLEKSHSTVIRNAIKLRLARSIDDKDCDVQ